MGFFMITILSGKAVRKIFIPLADEFWNNSFKKIFRRPSLYSTPWYETYWKYGLIILGIIIIIFGIILILKGFFPDFPLLKWFHEAL
jgi:hypothetical protein